LIPRRRDDIGERLKSGEPKTTIFAIRPAAAPTMSQMKVTMVRTAGKSLAFLLALGGPVYAQPKCLNSVRELKENNVKTKWYETTADDGKPMRIYISGNHGLAYQAIKGGDVWLKGTVSVCRIGDETQISLHNAVVTDKVPLLVRQLIPTRQTAKIINDKIEFRDYRWSGTFAAD
jgi:hypothetical protein